MATVMRYKGKDICFMNEDSFATFEDLKADLAAANHDVKELTRCVADYKEENKNQSKIIEAFAAYRNFILALTTK